MSQYRHGPQDCRACFENQEKEKRMVGSPSSHKSGKKRHLAVSALAALQPEGRA